MKTKILVTLICISISLVANAQWSVGAGLGPSFPVTGYGQVVETGVQIFNLQGKHTLGKGKLLLGADIQMARFSEDKNPTDAYYESKLTVAPVIFTLDYQMNLSHKLQPYITYGLGLSFFVFSYTSSPTEIDDQSIFNVSFSMMPALGLKYQASSHLYPFVETGLVLLMDGPPVGFPEGEHVTGYEFVTIGLMYKFVKQNQ